MMLRFVDSALVRDACESYYYVTVLLRQASESYGKDSVLAHVVHKSYDNKTPAAFRKLWDYIGEN